MCARTLNKLNFGVIQPDDKSLIDKLMKFYPFEQINEALVESHAGKCSKVVLKIE